MAVPSDAHEIVHVFGRRSPQIEEDIASVASVMTSWGYAIRAIGPFTRGGRGTLRAAGVEVQEISPTPGSAGWRWSEARGLAKTIRDAHPALIHAHGFSAGFAALRARGGGRAPTRVVLSPHLLPQVLRADNRLGLRAGAYRWVMERADAIVVPTEVQRRTLADLHPGAAERAEIIPYARPAGPQPDALDLGRRRALLGITQAAVVVGCVTDALADESLAEFLDAAASICMDYPSLEFALIGRRVDRERYHEMAHERGLLGATVFVDPHERFRRAISALNVLVTPQRGWPSGLLALEALAAQVGVVAPEDGEVAEILGGSPRVTVAPADGAGALGEAIIRRLQAAAQQMEPLHDVAPETGGAAVSMLVSKEFYDLEAPGESPERGRSEGEGARRSAAAEADPMAPFHPTLAARQLIALYHRMMDEG